MPWDDLEGEIAEEFGDYERRQGEVDGRLDDWSARGYARAERKRDEARRRRGSTSLSIETRRKSYATRYQQMELPLTKILKAENVQHASTLYHVDDGDGRPRCGVPAAGMFILDPEKLNRATCAACLSDVDLRMHPGAAVLDGTFTKKIYEAPPSAEQLRIRLIEAAHAYGMVVKHDVVITATRPKGRDGGGVRGKWPA